MTNLKHPPLIYTIGVLKFPRIPNIERFIDPFHEKIRSEFPFSEEFKVSMFNADLSNEGMKIVQKENKVWQFSSIEKNWAIILTEQSLCLHTVSYKFEQFAEHFQKALSQFIVIPEVGLDWITMTGLRYVNLITSQKKKLNDYVVSWVLPSEPPKDSLEILEGAYVTRYKTTAGELRLQALRNPPYTLPPDLQTSLLIKNKWIPEKPENEFSIIDIDHITSYFSPEKFDLQKVIRSFADLREISKTVFFSTGTELSHKLWRGK